MQQIFSIAKFSKYFTTSSYLKIFKKKVLFFQPSFPNWQYFNHGYEETFSFFIDILPSANSERLVLWFFIFWMSYTWVALCKRYYFKKLIPWSWENYKLHKHNKHNMETWAKVVKKSPAKVRTMKVKIGGFWNKLTSSLQKVYVVKN